MGDPSSGGPARKGPCPHTSELSVNTLLPVLPPPGSLTLPFHLPLFPGRSRLLGGGFGSISSGMSHGRTGQEVRARAHLESHSGALPRRNTDGDILGGHRDMTEYFAGKQHGCGQPRGDTLQCSAGQQHPWGHRRGTWRQAALLCGEETRLETSWGATQGHHGQACGSRDQNASEDAAAADQDTLWAWDRSYCFPETTSRGPGWSPSL